jgi:diaminohydroxyphosphoribosylaminopyrimidine deaminase/5-amino-6-(5-phosphoribosylamino)uracil reductase
VIVKNGKIIAEGYHKKYGTNHAERNAINSANRKKINLKGSVLYVNLEPCAHFGNTPPCAELIAQHKFSRVVIGMKDPYSKVNGKGIRILRKSGIKVKCGVLESECRELNRFFIKYVTTGLPYVTIKTAQTIDGKIADNKYNSKWISSLRSRMLVHAMRASYDAVLAGSNTVEHDDPELTVRLIKGRNPYRIVIDSKLRSSLKSKVFSDKNTDMTILITSSLADKQKMRILEKRNIKIISCSIKNGIINIKEALRKLTGLGISSIMVEGGAKTYSEFIKKGLVDEFMIFVAPKVMGRGIEAFTYPVDFRKFREKDFYNIDGDILINIK